MLEIQVETFRLSPLQRHLCALQGTDPYSPYRTYCGVGIKGSLDILRLQGAVEKAVERHEILHTVFPRLEGSSLPVQVITENCSLPLAVYDLSSILLPEQEKIVPDLLDSLRSLPFYLHKGSLFRVSLVIRAHEDHLLLIAASALIADIYTCNLFIREIGQFYDMASVDGGDQNEYIQYADMAEWQYELLESADTAPGRKYWQSTDYSCLTSAVFPTTRTVETSSSITFDSVVQRFSEVFVAQTEALAQRLNVAVAALFLSCWLVVLRRITGQSDLFVGTGYDGRKYEELLGAMGLFAKYVPLPFHLSDESSFSEFVRQIDERLRDASLWQEYFGWELLKAVDEEELEPFCSLGFDCGTLPPSIRLRDLVLSIEDQNTYLDRFHVRLSCVYSAQGLLTTLHYDRQLFDQDAMERLLAQWQTVLVQVLEEPYSILRHLQILTSRELHLLLQEWNATDTDYPRHLCVHTLVDEQVGRSPDRIAVVYEDHQLTYHRLCSEANRLAQYLQHQGVGPEVCVGLFLERSIEMLVALLGILKAGGAYVPLDISYPQERLAFMLGNAKMSLFLTSESLLTKLPMTSAQAVCLDRDWESIAQESADPPCSEVIAENLAYVIYTSGSTGQPKGVMAAHRELINYLCWCTRTYDIVHGDGTLVHSSLSFDLTVTGLLSPLLVGSKVFLLPEGHGIEELSSVLQASSHLSLVKLTPAHLELLNKLLVPEMVNEQTNAFIIGGEALYGSSLSFWHRYAPNTRLINEYGPTETVVGCCVYEVPSGTDERGPVPIGGPIANTCLYVLDEYQYPTSIGVPGELYIGGDGLTRGYLDRPELTAERFVPDPFSTCPGQRLYRTGDLVQYRHDGNLIYLGRLDHQVKIRGFRIELAEIEAHLLEHPAIHEAVVVAQGDIPRDKRLVAYIVGSPAQVMPSTDDLRIYLQSKLPDYMVPSFFLALRKLPLTTNGKVDREALPVPGINRPDLNSLFVPPQTEVEAILASIWSEVLHIKQIGIYDNFFSIGGDSILSIQLATLAKQAGLYFTPRQLFQYQTIVQLAGVATLNNKPSLVEPTLVYGPVPLTPIQHWFFALDMPRRHHYNFSGLFEIQMRLRPAHLQQAVQLILQRHDAFHLRFAYSEEGWHQYQSKFSHNIPFITIDLSNLSQLQQATSIEASSSAAQESLHLTTGPLLRSLFFERGGLGSDCLLLVVHHLVVDGVSWRILLSDLETALSQIVDNKDIRLPAKTSSFQYWSQKLQQYAQSEHLQQELPYWLAPKRAGVKSLPVDLSDGLNASIDSASISVHLDIQQTQELLQNVSSAYHTQINDLLLTALIRAFASWTGQHLLLVDFEGHGREESIDEIDLSHTVGWFTTIFPVLLDTEQAASIADEIKTVKELLRQIPQHGIGYGVLRYLHPEPDIRAQLASLPPAQVSFNYLGQFGSASSPSASSTKEAWLRRSPIPIGASYNNSGMRSHLLVINGSVTDGRLHFVWQYSRQIHRAETIQRLSQTFIDSLRDIIVHCQLPGIGGYTPSDFPLAALDQPTLDLLVRRSLPIEQAGHNQSIEDIYPLSPMQTGMLFHSLYTVNEGVYHGQFGWIIEGDFNIWAWQWAWQQVVNRHSILRTLFLWQGLTEPVQVVMRDVQLPWSFYDWRGLALHEQRALLNNLYQEDRQRNFDLEKAPLLRPTLIYLGERSYYFLLSQHHLLWDGWSQPLLFSEVQKLYHAYRHGSDYDLQPIRPYRDYIAWLQQQDKVGAEQFWRMYLAGFHLPTFMVADHCSSLGRGQTNNATSAQHLRLSREKTNALQQLAQHHQLTMNTILQGVWGWLLALYSGEKEVIFGATVAGRPAEVTGVESMIGLFINTLPVRIQITADTPVIAWLSQLQQQQVEMRQYEYTPLSDIQRWSNVPADRSLFEYLFLFQNYPLPQREERKFDGRELTPTATNELDIHRERNIEHTNYSLTIVASVSQDILFLNLSYDDTRFDAAFIRRLLEHFGLVLEALGSQWHQRLADLPRLTKGEQELVLSTWNTTARSAPEKLCLHHLFEARVVSTPDTIAVQDEERCFSYSFLNTQANQLAHLLLHIGVGPEVRVGICLERSYTQFVAVLGILKAGGAYVPLDPASPQQRLNYLCQDAQVSLIVTQQSLLGRLPESFPHILCLDKSTSSLLAQPCANLDRPLLAEYLAYIIYTSGSTGKPKGVLITHQGITNLARAQIAAFAVQAGSRVLQFASSSFDASVSEIVMALASGATLCLVPAQTVRTGPDLLQLLVQQAITVVTLPPSVLATLPLEPLPVLSSLVVAGEACPHDLVARWAPGRRFYNAYGPTEGTVCATISLYQEHSETIPIGRPIANTEIYVLDSQLQPVGVPGELYLGGIGLARGYHQQPDITAERFVPHPFSQEPGARLYKTGDKVRFLPTGELVFLGRTDLQIKVRGVRVELEEIEQVLNRHPAVHTCVVTAAQVSQENHIVAYILPAEGQTPLISALRQYMLELVPDVMVPSSFIMLRQLPLTLNGKIDRKTLSLIDVQQRSSEETFVAPRTALETQLATMWQELLHVQQVSIEDSFFDLGGDSIKAALFINRLQKMLGVIVYVVTLFDVSTILGLADYLGTHHPAVIRERFGQDSLPGGEQTTQRVTAAHVAQLRALIPPLLPAQPTDTSRRGKNPPAVFLLSPPRSGSTLLRVMLAGNPRLFAPPELELLSFNTLQERFIAFQGRNSFWLEGTVRLLMELKGWDAKTAQAFMTECEQRGLSVKEFYALIQQWLGEKLLVDKTPAYSMDMAILQRAEEDFTNARYIHLVRHPYGMIRSFEEASLDQVFLRFKHPFVARELAELVWLIGQQNIVEFLKGIPEDRQYTIYFEELVQEPEAAMRRLCQFLEIEYDPAMLKPYEGKKMTDGITAQAQMLGDVKFHQHHTIDAAIAQRWQHEYKEDFLGEITWQKAEALGYQRLNQAQHAGEHEAQAVQDGQRQLLPIPRVERGPHQHFPLSFAQQRLWFLDQLEPGSTVYLVSNTQRITGRLYLAALEWSLLELVERHESLRTTFEVHEGQPVQVIHPTGSFPLPVVDMYGLKREEREKRVHRLAYQEKQQPCDLQRGPLLRITLLRLDAEEHILLITVHHIISDGWSMQVFRRELVTLYEAFVTKQPSPLPPLPIQYADFASWQRQWLQGAVLERQVVYWRTQLTGVPPLELPTDHRRPMIQSHQGEVQTLILPLVLQERLQTLSQQRQVTLFMLLLATFQVLLARLSGQTDIAVGSPIANRAHEALEGLIGFFVNTLVLRNQVQGELSFLQFLEQVRGVALGAYAHQDVPFEQLVEMLQPERDLSRSTLFQVMFTLQQSSSSEVSLPEPPAHVPQPQPSRVSQATPAMAKFDLTLDVMDSPQGLHCRMNYSTDLFEASTIQRFLQYWQCMLEGIVARPETAVFDLPLLPASEVQLLEKDWNATAASYPGALCLHERFEDQVTRTPDAIALVFEEEQLTYWYLNRCANQLAHQLQSCGIGLETSVGICLERSPSQIIAVLATLKAAGMYLPLDPQAPPERLAWMLQDAQVALVLTQQHLRERLPVGMVTCLCLDADWQVLAAQEEGNLRVSVDPAMAAYVLYTSGSTGQPKGVVVEHRQVMNYIAAIQEQAGLTAPASYAMLQPLTVDSCVTMLFPALLLGGVLHLISYDRSLDARALAWYFLDHQIDYLKIAPSHLFALMMEKSAQRALPRRKLIIGGEASQWNWVQMLQSLLPAGGLYNHYGPTETTVGSLLYPVMPEQMVEEGTLTPLGRPLGNTHVYVLDPQMRLQPLGVVGELYIGGAGLTRGYVGRPDVTAERFLPHPWSQVGGERLYKTGDLVRYRINGTIEFVGRSDEQVKIRGYRIEPGEIEVVLGQHPAVQEARVVVVESEGQKQLIGYLVGNEGMVGPGQNIRDFIRKSLPDYMVPSGLYWLEELPRTPHGKVNRNELVKMAQEQLVEPEMLGRNQGSAIEELVAGMWCQVLAVKEAKPDAQFFALGGHSLLAAQLISRIRATLQIEIPLRWLFETPKLIDLAKRIEEALRDNQGEEAMPLAPVSRQQALPLSFAQMRLWFLDQLEPGSLLYVIPGVHPLHGILDIGLLERSLEALVQRHESLRTTFQECKQGAELVQSGQPMQIIHPVERFYLPVIDLSSLAPEVRKNQARYLPQQAMLTPFNLTQGPLLRTWILRLHADEHLFVVMMHHIISDGWSMNVFYHELRVLYQAFSAGQPSPLQPLPIQYADFAAWQRQQLQGKMLEQQLDYWRQQLSGASPLILPADYPRPAVVSHRGSGQSFSLSSQLSQALITLSRQEDVTPFMLLLTAFQILFYRYSGQKDIVVGTDSANRNRAETENLIGFFINVLALRTTWHETLPFRQLLRHVREMMLEAYTHQETPFELLVDKIVPDHALDQLPLVQVLFVMQNFPDLEEHMARGQAAGERQKDAPMQPLGERELAVKFDLALFMEEREGQFYGSLNYCLDLFTARTIATMIERFATLLQSIVQQPDASIDQLDFLTVAEREQQVQKKQALRSKLRSHKGTRFDLP